MPKNDCVFNLRLPRKTAEKLQRASSIESLKVNDRVTMSEIIRRAIDHYVKDHTVIIA